MCAIFKYKVCCVQNSLFQVHLTVTYQKNKFVYENRLSYDNIGKGHQEQTGIA